MEEGVSIDTKSVRICYTYVKILFSVKSVKPVTGPTQVPAPVVFGSSEAANVAFAQNPPKAFVSFVKKYPQHLNLDKKTKIERCQS